jgi:hypothetical protein
VEETEIGRVIHLPIANPGPVSPAGEDLMCDQTDGRWTAADDAIEARFDPDAEAMKDSRTRDVDRSAA